MVSIYEHYSSGKKHKGFVCELEGVREKDFRDEGLFLSGLTEDFLPGVKKDKMNLDGSA